MVVQLNLILYIVQNLSQIKFILKTEKKQRCSRSKVSEKRQNNQESLAALYCCLPFSPFSEPDHTASKKFCKQNNKRIISKVCKPTKAPKTRKN